MWFHPCHDAAAARAAHDDFFNSKNSLRWLLHAVAFAHGALQAGPVDEVEGLFFVGEHGEGGSAGVCNQG